MWDWTTISLPQNHMITHLVPSTTQLSEAELAEDNFLS
jgi:hypothetical protein